jgi:hypothetical protein
MAQMRFVEPYVDIWDDVFRAHRRAKLLPRLHFKTIGDYAMLLRQLKRTTPDERSRLLIAQLELLGLVLLIIVILWWAWTR